MGTLKPDTTYIYERADGVIYARESGKDERMAIGWDYDTRTPDGRPLHDHLKDDKLWNEIRKEAKQNPTLQSVLDRAIMIYRLSKDKPL